MTQQNKQPKQYRGRYHIDVQKALELFNTGKTAPEIALHFPGSNADAVKYAIRRAVRSGLGTARHGLYHPPQPVPPMAALWQEL
jgi:hypothetical protein